MDARVLLPTLLVALLAALTGWLLYRLGGPIDEGAISRNSPDGYAKQVELVAMGSDGLPHHRLSGKALRHYPGDNHSEMDQPRLTVLRGGKVTTVTASADNARLSGDGKVLTLEHKVHVERLAPPAPQPLVVDTESLTVWPDQDRFASSVPVTLISGTTRFNAVGMRGDWASGKYTLLSHVRGIYEPH